MLVSSLAPIGTPPDLVERVHQALADAISRGTLAPGQRLTQEDIARQLAVSRQPVLQALRLLRQEGLVLDAPGRGVQVAPLDAHDIACVYQVRGALDALAAKLAAQRRVVLDPVLVAAGRRATRGRDLQAMVEADIAFHRAIYDAADNPLIRRSAEQHWQHIRRTMAAALQPAALRATVWDEHEAIAAAIAAGDADAAAAHSADHAERASTFLTGRLRAVPAPTSDHDPARPDGGAHGDTR